MYQKVKEQLSELHTIEHCFRYSLNCFEDKSEEITKFIQYTIETYEKVINKANSLIISILSVQNKSLLASLQRINNDFVGLSLNEIKKIIDHGRDSLKDLEQRNYMHWCE